MGYPRNPSSGPYSSSLQHLFEYIDELNRPLQADPSLDSLLAYTHRLSNTLSNTLNNLVRATGESDGQSLAYVQAAIDEATESITTARGRCLSSNACVQHRPAIRSKSSTSTSACSARR